MAQPVYDLRRLDLGLTQAGLASQIGTSRKWISEFEAGKPPAELGLVPCAVEGVGLVLHIGATDASQAPADLDLILDEYRSR
jgi:HTH-type transcriptional regulator / antitoxin HipB